MNQSAGGRGAGAEAILNKTCAECSIPWVLVGNKVGQMGVIPPALPRSFQVRKMTRL